jgi:hypothetical protein
MLAAGFSSDDVDTVLWRNPVEFYGRSGRLEIGEVVPGAVDNASGESGRKERELAAAGATFLGNSVLRGARE